MPKEPRKKIGIPRTSAGADRYGFARSKVQFDTLSDVQKKKWIVLLSDDVIHGQIGMISPRRSSGTRTVCYYDKNTGKYDDCRNVPV
jgi:hypothetical protein